MPPTHIALANWSHLINSVTTPRWSRDLSTQRVNRRDFVKKKKKKKGKTKEEAKKHTRELA